MENTPQTIEPSQKQKDPERLKKVAQKTKEVLGFLALLGAGTAGMYAAVKSGDINAILPPGLRDVDDGQLLSESIAFTGLIVSAGREAYGLNRDRRRKKKGPDTFLNASLQDEIAGPSRDEDSTSAE